MTSLALLCKHGCVTGLFVRDSSIKCGDVISAGQAMNLRRCTFRCVNRDSCVAVFYSDTSGECLLVREMSHQSEFTCPGTGSVLWVIRKQG